MCGCIFLLLDYTVLGGTLIVLAYLLFGPNNAHVIIISKHIISCCKELERIHYALSVMTYTLQCFFYVKINSVQSLKT